ncbi:MAG: D-alanyl-D-alanine carboxypeptidase [Eubacterium sp.]|nr:D-alanyl-D-alanine carboxypeptidase [Eubacterium sp.]
MKKHCALLAAALTICCLSAGCGSIDLTSGTSNGDPSQNSAASQSGESVVDVFNPSGQESTVNEPTFTPDDSFVGCRAAVCYDLTNKEIIYEKNLDLPIYPASLTKLLTALVAVEYLDENYVCTVGSEIDLIAYDSTRSWISEGEQYMRNDLLTAMLTPSGNDAAYSVAANVVHKVYGADIYDEDITAYFSILMNNYAKSIGCENTHFTVPDGYHEDEHITTCGDMLKIAEAAANSPAIVGITSQDLAVVYDLDGYTHSWENGNMLLWDPYTEYVSKGLKTGYTDEAGFCFAGLAELDGKQIITLTFDCDIEYRYDDTLKLMDLGFGLYDEDNNYRGEYAADPDAE